jgi:hypothetical protein
MVCVACPEMFTDECMTLAASGKGPDICVWPSP